LCDLGRASKSFGTRKSSTYLARRLATARLQLAAVMMTRARIIQSCTRVKFTLFRCTSAELFFSCCGNVAETTWAPRPTTCAAPRAMARRNGEVPSTRNERRRGQRPGHHDK
jgi:hypothetical protein